MSKLFYYTGIAVWVLVIFALVSVFKKSDRMLVRSKADRRLLGICGGIGEYFNLDPNLIRVIWALVTICGGSGILAYIIAAFIMPEPDAGTQGEEDSVQEYSDYPEDNN